MRAWRVSGWNPLAIQNGFPILDINMEDIVHPIVKDILFKKIDTFLQEVFRRKGEMKWAHWKGWGIENHNQKIHPT